MLVVRRKQWGLRQGEWSELSAIVEEAGEPPSWFPGAPRPDRALRRPESAEPALELRRRLALTDWVTSIDATLARALRDFMPDELWRLLNAIELAENGVPRKRVQALEHGEAEYRMHADEAVAVWRDHRRIRERALAMAVARGLRGWDDPERPQFRNSAPLESDRRNEMLSVEAALLSHAVHRVALWCVLRARTAGVDQGQRRVALRREVVSLLASAGLGYTRIASLATGSYWRRPPCPSLRRDRLMTLVKADLRATRRLAAEWSAAVET